MTITQLEGRCDIEKTTDWGTPPSNRTQRTPPEVIERQQPGECRERDGEDQLDGFAAVAAHIDRGAYDGRF